MKNPKIKHCPKCGTKLIPSGWGSEVCPNCGRKTRNPKNIPHKVESVNTLPRDFNGEYPCQYSSKRMEHIRRQGGRDLIKKD